MATASVQPSRLESNSESAVVRTQAFSLVWGGWMLLILGMWLGSKFEDLSRAWVFLFWGLGALSFGCGFSQCLRFGSWHVLGSCFLAGFLLFLFPLAILPLSFLWLGLLLGIGLFRVIGPSQPATQNPRHLLGLFTTFVGLVLIGVSLFLYLSFGLTAFGEVVGMALIGLCAVVTGIRAIKGTPAADQVFFFDRLRSRSNLIGLLLLLIGVALGLTGIAFALIARFGQSEMPEFTGTLRNGIPEIVCLLLMGLLSFIGGLWMTNAKNEGMTASKMRVLVLVVGGCFGFILAGGALARAVIWSSDVFGGMRAWQGERSWHLWLCAYVELIGLAIMFASLLSARPDVRTSAVLRRVLYGYNAVLTGLLLLATLVVFNIVVYAMVPYSFEWTKSRGAYTLSISSKNLLANLRVPTSLYVLMPKSGLTPELSNFLENCQSESNMVQVKYVSPVSDQQEYEDLVKRFPDIPTGAQGSLGRGVLIVYGQLSQDKTTKAPPHVFVTADRFEEVQQNAPKEEGSKGTVFFKGESEIMKELSFFAKDRKKTKVYVLQGNGEPDINQQEMSPPRINLKDELASMGCGQMVEALKKEQFEVQGLSFAKQLPKDKTTNLVFATESGPDKRKEVPADADALIIAGPGVPLDAAVLGALERYMDKGGKLLVFLEIVLDAQGKRMINTGLGDFLRKYGVLAGDDFALRLAGDPREVIATTPRESSNELARDFARYPFKMQTVRIVRPDPEAKKYKAEVVLQLDRRVAVPRPFYYMAENNVKALEDPVNFLEDLDKQGALDVRISPDPLPVALAVSEKLLDPGTGKETLKPRMMVFGDAECLTNYFFVRVQQGYFAYPWVTGGLEWMAEKPGLIGPRPLEAPSYTFGPTVNVDRIKTLPLWLMLLTTFSFGAGIWVIRRR